MAILDVITNLQTKARSIPGIQFAPDNPPDNSSVYPFAVTYLRKGLDLGGSSGFSNVQHVAWTEFHFSRQLLNNTITISVPVIEAFLKLLIADPKLGNTVSTIENISYTFGRLEWAGLETIGVRFEITFKMLITS